MEENKEGARFNQGKAKWSLVPQTALLPMVKVLEFGAKKYTKIIVPLLENRLKQWNVKIVTKIEPLELKDYVAVVMKNNCFIMIKSIKRGKQPTKKSIDKEIWKDLKKQIEKETWLDSLILNSKNEKEMLTILGSMESVPKNLIEERKKVVKFVESKKPQCMQTITMILGNLEVSFVVSAITGLDSSTTTLKCLEELLNISLSKEEFISEGKNNWMKGLSVTEICESVKRHLDAFMECQDNDPESGLSHIGHIQCNAMFLAWMMENRPDKDDRFDVNTILPKDKEDDSKN